MSWRGNATEPDPALAQFNPKVWNLSAGIHTIYLIEREPMSIESVTFNPAAAPTPTPTPGPSPTPSVKPVVKVIAPPEVDIQVEQSPAP